MSVAGSRGFKLMRLPGLAAKFNKTSVPSVRGFSIFVATKGRHVRAASSATTRWIHSSAASHSIPAPVQNEEYSEKALSYHYEVGSYPLVNWTFGRLIDRAAAAVPNDRVYVFVEEKKEFSFGEFQEAVNNCAKGLLSMGLKKGDTLMLFAPNTTYWLLLFAACAKIGVLSASVHPGYSKQELFNALDKVKAKAIFIPEEFKILKFYENLCKWIPELSNSAPGQLNSSRFPHLKTVIVESQHALPGTVNIDEVVSGAKDVDFEAAEAATSCDDPLTVIFTSGTTGAAKAACLAHHAFVNNVIVAHNTLHKGMDYKSVVLCPLPLFHVFGLMNASLPFISYSPTIFPARGYDQIETMKAIEAYRCTEMSGSPTMYIDLINHPERTKYDLSSLRKCIMGGSICTTELRQTVERGFPHALALTGYGATETSTVATALSPCDPVEKRMHTVGKPIAHTEVKIANPDTGVEVPCGEAGEVWVRGFNIFNGYLGEEDKTREVLTPSRWYRSGDMGTMDSDGYVSIVGRLKDLIIRGGENIHPIDIETQLDSHPAVEESHVVSVPDKRLCEEVCAVVVLKDGQKVTEDELRQFLKGKIAYFKMPKYFIFEHDVPKTAIGKAQKNKIRVTAAQKLGL